MNSNVAWNQIVDYQLNEVIQFEKKNNLFGASRKLRPQCSARVGLPRARQLWTLKMFGRKRGGRGVAAEHVAHPNDVSISAHCDITKGQFLPNETVE